MLRRGFGPVRFLDVQGKKRKANHGVCFYRTRPTEPTPALVSRARFSGESRTIGRNKTSLELKGPFKAPQNRQSAAPSGRQVPE